MILVCCSRMWAVKTCESAEQATPNASAVTMRARFRNAGFCSGGAAMWRYASPRADVKSFFRCNGEIATTWPPVVAF